MSGRNTARLHELTLSMRIIDDELNKALKDMSREAGTSASTVLALIIKDLYENDPYAMQDYIQQARAYEKANPVGWSLSNRKRKSRSKWN